MFQLVAFVALAYSVDIYSHYPSSLFHHSVKAYTPNGYIHCRQLLIGHLTFVTLVQKVNIGHKNFMLL